MKMFKDMNVGTVVIVCLLVLSILLTAYNTYSTYEIKQIITGAKAVQAPAKPSVKRPSDYKFGEEYSKAVTEEKPMMLLFYADWCHYCIDFMPKFEALYKKYKNKYNFVKINVEDPNYMKEVEKYNIQGFPSVFLVNTKTDKNIQLDNGTFGDLKHLEKDLEDFYKKNN